MTNLLFRIYTLSRQVPVTKEFFTTSFMNDLPRAIRITVLFIESTHYLKIADGSRKAAWKGTALARGAEASRKPHTCSDNEMFHSMFIIIVNYTTSNFHR